MIFAQEPKNEKARLKVLKEYQILDTERETQFSEISDLASLICNTPVALIAFLDKDRNWFKASTGIEIYESPRNISFCSHAIVSDDEVFEIENLEKDNRFFDNPLVDQEPKVKFYAGVPLKDQSGFALGTLCVFHMEPHNLTDFQKKALKMLGKQVMKLLELHRFHAEAEKKGKEIKKNLEKKVKQRTKELILTNEKLKAKNEEVEQLVYIASHDLKEPIRKIKLYSDLLIKKSTESSVDISLINKIQSSADRAHLLVNDILSYASIHEDKKKYKTLDLNAIIEDVKESLVENIRDSKAEIIVEKLGKIKGDASQFFQLFQNLISNSIKYNMNQPRLEIKGEVVLNAKQISADIDNQKQNYYCISITDNGIGFDLKYKDKIFDFFQRLHKNTEYNGTGIGLSIVKKIVLAHKGYIEVESEQKKGSSFKIYLPL
ncbi:GAF domain-containing sensor histidine kinase [Lacihabitans lacunae]|uniref:histidine kinase n=1 Tax=Lacihabitans lacunae TaxID=1028214 RepID=A0ABV7YTP0_9BACT